MSGVRVRFLGTGDAFGSGGRLQTSTHLTSEAGTLLVDCGPSALAAMRSAGLEPGAVDAIALTHLHGDHFGGIPFLLLHAHYSDGRTRDLTVAGPAGVQQRVLAAVDALFPGTDTGAFRFRLKFVEMAAGQPCDLGVARVTAFEVRHAKALACHALRVECGGRVLAFSGDTEWAGTLVEASRDADLFLCECQGFAGAPPGHLSHRALVEHRAELACTRVLLTHMGDDVLCRTDLAFDTVRDGMTIDL